MAQPKRKNVKYSTRNDKPASRPKKPLSTREKLAKRGIGGYSQSDIAMFKAMAQTEAEEPSKKATRKYNRKRKK